MASVEGVARRIDADHDIWDAARPIVERWVGREVSPLAQGKRLVERSIRALEGVARWAEQAPLAQETLVVERAGLPAGLGTGLAIGLALGALLIALFVRR
jgi:ubiquinone biosynthesis protein